MPSAAPRPPRPSPRPSRPGRPPLPSPRPRPSRPLRPPSVEGIRITTVGLWFVLLSLVVAVAATNTGNNALYAVLSVMFGLLILSGLLSRQNVRGMAVELEEPGEVFANRPFALHFTLVSRALLLPRWFLQLRLTREAAGPMLVPYMARRERVPGSVELMVARRGRHRFDYAHVSSLFPFGFFRKGVRYHPAGIEVLVFPEIFAAGGSLPDEPEAPGDSAARRPGWGHALFALRSFRHGDDPRGIHWKQTARTGTMVYMEREAERTRRLSILFDNAVGTLEDPARQQRFERLVSEAATAALDHLAHGYLVELVTRDRTLGFAAGARQRLAILEMLALVEPVPRRREPLLASDPRTPQLRLHLDAGAVSPPAAVAPGAVAAPPAPPLAAVPRAAR
jgi:uncharacterized protein (DUF58 family)